MIVFLCTECKKLRDSATLNTMREDGGLVGDCCGDHEIEHVYAEG